MSLSLLKCVMLFNISYKVGLCDKFPQFLLDQVFIFSSLCFFKKVCRHLQLWTLDFFFFYGIPSWKGRVPRKSYGCSQDEQKHGQPLPWGGVSQPLNLAFLRFSFIILILHKISMEGNYISDINNIWLPDIPFIHLYMPSPLNTEISQWNQKRI